MVLDTSGIGFLIISSALEYVYKHQLPSYFAIFESEIRNAAGGRHLSLREVLVHLINTLRDVIVRFVEQLASVKTSSARL